MTISIRPCLVVCLALLTTGLPATTTGSSDAAPASPKVVRQFDDVIYEVPKDWRTGKTRPEYAQVYSNESPIPTIRVYRSETVPRSVRSWMKKKALSSFDEDDRRDAQDKNYKKVKQGPQTFHILGLAAGREMRVAMAAVGEEKANLFLLDIRIPRDREIAEKRTATLTRDFVRFCTSSKFVSQGAQPLLGKPVGGDLEGPYFGLTYTYNLDQSTNFTNRFYVFSKTGRFYRGLPEGDAVANLDFEQAMRLFPNKAGNYKVRNGKVLLELANGDTDKEALRTETVQHPRALTKATIPTDGTKLDGFFNDLHYSGFTPGSAVSGGVAQQKTYTFSPSGEFKATAFHGSFGSFSGGGFSTGTKSPDVHGTYAIKEGALILTDSTGKNATCSIVQIGESLLFINGDQYLKKARKKTKSQRR